MLTLTNITKNIGSETIFSDLNLCFAANSFTALLGPSGCGKSTFFDILTGIKTKDQGTIAYLGKTVESLIEHAAYMQQKDLLLPWATVMENAYLPAISRGDKSASTKEKCLQYLENFGLLKFRNHKPAELSGGMRQRVALARTLMFERDIILLDEPLSALDALTRRSMQNMLLALQKDFGKTIIMITHDIDEALLLANKLFLFSALPMTVVQHYSLTSSQPRHFNDSDILTKKAELLTLLSRGMA